MDTLAVLDLYEESLTIYEEEDYENTTIMRKRVESEISMVREELKANKEVNGKPLMEQLEKCENTNEEDILTLKKKNSKSAQMDRIMHGINNCAPKLATAFIPKSYAGIHLDKISAISNKCAQLLNSCEHPEIIDHKARIQTVVDRGTQVINRESYQTALRREPKEQKLQKKTDGL